MNMQLTNVRQLIASSSKANASVPAGPSFRAAIAAVRDAARDYTRCCEAAVAANSACWVVETEHGPSDLEKSRAGDGVPVPAILMRPRKPASGGDVIKVIMERADGTATVLDYTTPEEAEYTMSYGELAEYYKDDQAKLVQAQHAYNQWLFDKRAAGEKLIPAIVLEARAAAQPSREARAKARRARDAACEALLSIEAGQANDELLKIRTLLEAHGAHITRAGGVANFDDIFDEHPRMASRVIKLMLDGWRRVGAIQLASPTDVALAEYTAVKSLDAHLAHHGDVGACCHGDRLSEAEDALLSTAPTGLSGISARLGAIIGFAWSGPHGDWDCPLCPEKRANTLAAISPPKAGDLYNAEDEDRDDALFRALAFLHQGIDRLPGSAAPASSACQIQSAAA